jgi:hypothetical protein
MCHSPHLKACTPTRLTKVRFQNVDFMCKHFVTCSHCFFFASASQLPTQKLNSETSLSTSDDHFQTCQLGVTSQPPLLALAWRWWAKKCMRWHQLSRVFFIVGGVFTGKVATLLTRALVPLPELDLVSALSLTLLLMIMMACLHVVWWGWLVREHAAMGNMSAVDRIHARPLVLSR